MLGGRLLSLHQHVFYITRNTNRINAFTPPNTDTIVRGLNTFCRFHSLYWLQGVITLLRESEFDERGCNFFVNKVDFSYINILKSNLLTKNLTVLPE